MNPLALTLSAFLQSADALGDYRAELAAGPQPGWAAGGALDLLERLRRNPRRLFLVPLAGQRGFVAESDLPALLERLDDPEPCAVVLQPISAHLPTRPSTVGHEAALLVEAFRRGRYPLSPASDLRHVDLDGLRDWWSLYARLRPARDLSAGEQPEAGPAYVADFRLAAGWEPVAPLPDTLALANLEDFGELRFGLWKTARLTFRILKTESPAGMAGPRRHTAEILRVQ